MINLSKYQRGQALLVIVLIMFVGLTVSLTLISRTTTDIKFSREFEESSKALSAAEAGIEEALRGAGVGGQQTIVTGVTYEVVTPTPMLLAERAGVAFSLGKIEAQNVATVWLAEYETWNQVYTADRIALCWQDADADPPDPPDIEAIILYKNDNDPVNPYKVARDFFKHGDYTSGGTCDKPSFYSYGTDISFTSIPDWPVGITLLALRLKPIGSDSNIVGGGAFIAVDPPEVVPGNSLPSQGTEFISTGKAGDTTRKVRVVKSYPSWPEIFDYVLFSGTNLRKD